MALQPFVQEGNPVIKFIDQDPNPWSAISKGSSKPGGTYMLSLVY